MSDLYPLIPTRSEWATLYFRGEDLLQALTDYYAADLPVAEAECFSRAYDGWGRVFSNLHPALNHALVHQIPEVRVPPDVDFFGSTGERLPPLSALTISEADVEQLKTARDLLCTAASASSLGEILADIARHGAMTEAEAGPTAEDFRRSLTVMLLRPGLELLLRIRGNSGQEPTTLSPSEETEYRSLWCLIRQQLGGAGTPSR